MKLSYEDCLKLKELGIDQTLRCGDWYYRDLDKGIESKLHESTNDFKIPNDYFIKCKIPTEQDVRNWMTPDKYSLFESFLFKGGGVPLHITKIRGIAEFKKDNYLQLMVDWIIKERVK